MCVKASRPSLLYRHVLPNVEAHICIPDDHSQSTAQTSWRVFRDALDHDWGRHHIQRGFQPPNGNVYQTWESI